ncbi:RidA family protein [Pseudonocardia acaciae]|uniref:RidA family protein n=1 Tax=Pseudonocardia acaciae TaxID=551276 RepID=UPI00048CF2C2|nr:Rid family hydrolase [Pseudonocardia acaciae]
MIEKRNGELHPTSGYSHVTVVDPGRLVFLAGQMPMDDSGQGVVGIGDLDAQVDRTIENSIRALRLAGARPADVVRSVVYVVATDYQAPARAWHRFHRSEIGAALTAASTLVGVSTLGFPDQLVELELTAAIA